MRMARIWLIGLMTWVGLALSLPASTPAVSPLQRVIQDGDWSTWQETQQKQILEQFARAPRFVPAQRFQAVINAENTALALAQVTFLRRVTPEGLKQFASTPPKQQLLRWLLNERAVLEDFLTTLQPDEEAITVLDRWAELWQADPKGREKYYRLALACAVVFDRPVPIIPQLAYGEVDMLERYNYFRAAADISALCAPITELAPSELVWVVDAPVPNSELEWARRNVKYARAQWSSAYSSVTYRMEKAMRGAELYKSYTLAEIRAKGGICGDQAHFATISAKANGIPAMAIFGTGQRGGHVWFGYKATAQDWNLKAGRYQDDDYATGYAVHPQSGQQIKEQELYLLADPQSRQPAYAQADRLLWLAALLKPVEPGAATEALEVAVDLCPRHLPAWTALITALQKNPIPRLKWDQRLAAMRSHFRAYPDVITQINRWDIDYLKATGSPEQTAEALRAQQRRLRDRYPDRSDLLLEIVAERVALFETKGDLDSAEQIYRSSLRDDARELAVWKSLADKYFDFGVRHNRRRQTTRRILEEFRRFPLPQNEAFALRAYAGLERQVAGYLEQDGQASQAKSLRAQADNRERQATNLR